MVLFQKKNFVNGTSFLLKLKNHTMQLLTGKDFTYWLTGKNMLTWKLCKGNWGCTLMYGCICQYAATVTIN